jgi:peptidyl-tRNA hydrolase, PTH1 family
MTAIRLIVGLGNPGREYETTRHNVGFRWVDELARLHKLNFKNESRFRGLFARDQLHGHEVLLLMPQTFMNASGLSVGALVKFYKVEPAEMLVVHDELDLLPGVARLKKGGGHGGHNGLKDIIAHLGSRDFWRLRIGIGHPGDRDEVSNYVLNDPLRKERVLIDEAMQQAQKIAQLVIDGKTEAAMLKLHSEKSPKQPC